MRTPEIAAWLKRAIEPLRHPISGDQYRASVVLTDDTYLPCVIFQSIESRLELAVRRFDELRDQPERYRGMVATFVAFGSRLDNDIIKTVEPSPFAWPLATLATIHGETRMGWTAFAVEMHDGSLHSFGTNFSREIFDLLQGYTSADIAQIHSGMVYSQAGGMVPYSFSYKAGPDMPMYREKPYFTCYLPGL